MPRCMQIWMLMKAFFINISILYKNIKVYLSYFKNFVFEKGIILTLHILVIKNIYFLMETNI